MIKTRWLKRKERRQRPGVSLFTAFIAGFSLVITVIQMFVLNTSAECAYAGFWITGWFGFASVFHFAAVAVSTLGILFLIRIIAGYERNAAEAAMQGVLISSLIAFMLALKAFVFPYGTPSSDQYASLVNQLSPMRAVLLEEPITEATAFDWPFDYPAPPPRPVRPDRDPSINKRISEIFTSRNSPTLGEYSRLKQCISEYRSAREHYPADLDRYREWQKGFDEWRFAHPRDYELQRKNLPGGARF
ncbi:MAG: hypothetical protein R3C60_07385 [Parvularculaceae bacterium]